MKKPKDRDSENITQPPVTFPRLNQPDPVRLIFVDPFSGISGDMMLGALLDLGVDPARLRCQLDLLPLEGYEIAIGKCMRAGIRATKFDVRITGAGHGHDHAHGRRHHSHPHRSYRDIAGMINASRLSPRVREKSLEAFRRLAEAEGKIHNQEPDQVHFHEVGAVDSIVDIVGTMIALEELRPARILSSAVNVGNGTLECQHGIYPVPAPATQELLRGIPTFSNSIQGELTTPTGAALLVTLAEEFGPRPQMNTQATGYGAGTRETPGSANVLRLTLGEELSAIAAASPESEVAVVEATIDDMSPQLYGYFQDKAIAAGALDVFATPIQMKKNRPALLLTLVCASDLLEPLCGLIFEETTTIGIRYTFARRKTLQREFVPVETAFGAVTVKVSRLGERMMNAVPEYEDCRRLALEKGVPLKEVLAAASCAFHKSRHPS